MPFDLMTLLKIIAILTAGLTGGTLYKEKWLKKHAKTEVVAESRTSSPLDVTGTTDTKNTKNDQKVIKSGLKNEAKTP